MDAQAAKRAVGERAAGLVADGTRIGLGTGSTARWFIAAVGRRCAQGLRVTAVATSRASEEQAREVGIPIADLDEEGIDLAVDGADAVDPELRLIKGLGGALIREKIVAAAARRFVVVVDESKLMPRLGGALPVEIIPFGHRSTLAALTAATAVTPRMRADAGGTPFVTDNGNLIADCRFDAIGDAEGLAGLLEAIPGVVGHGLFLGMADLVLAARADGRIDELRAERGAGGLRQGA